ncbi:hypothetical protein Tco_0843323 [Tanacetum coccineum]|uniref:Integrase, catalytic region, zinc finger, CCHC-type, peptidase aspartic, catalytic n=1 Tax=Tanacetum coccineum TaxID=301880 RepID=A0ABQ5B2N2_9ASTR
MKGTEMTKQERESMLYDEFDKFTSNPRESIHSYYIRYAKLISDMNMIPMSMTPMQINTKFVNHLQPEWSSSLYYSKFPPTNNQLRTSSNPRTQDTIQNGQVMVQHVQGRQSQELGYIENIVSTNESYDELKGNSDVISYTDYTLTIRDDADNYVPPPVQKNDMMLSVIKQMKSQVEQCTKSSSHESEQSTRSSHKVQECIKRRTTLSPHEIGSRDKSYIKGAFKKDGIPFSENLKETFKFFETGFIAEVKEMKDIFEQMEDEVDQCSVAKKSFKSEKKQLLINNDRLLEENIASDIMCTYLRSLNEVDNCGKCKSLDIVLLDLQESNKSLSELRKRFTKLEEYNITLDIAFQNHKEQMILNNPDTKNKQLLVKIINNQSVEINDLKVQVQDKIQKIEDENVSLAFQTREKTKLQTVSLQQKLNDQISQNNKLRAQSKGKFSESQMNHNGISVNTKLSKPLTSGTKLYSVTPFPNSKVIPKVVEKNNLSKSVTSLLTTKKIIEKCAKVLSPGLLKIGTEPINAYFKNNRAVHRNYLRVTKEHVATLQELLEQARALKPLDEHIGYASKFDARIQELLVYVSASCPYTQSGNEKWAPVTSHRKNNKPYVDASRMKQTIETITKEHTVKKNTRKNDNTMLPSTGRVSFTNASGSKPRSNTKNDRILQPSSRSMKNKVEAHHKKFKSSANKNNHVSDCNANVKNVALVDKSTKQKVKSEWKPTGRIFKTVGLKWVPTGRMFTLAESKCSSSLSRDTTTKILPNRQIPKNTAVPVDVPCSKLSLRYANARESLFKCMINLDIHLLNLHDFGFEGIIRDEELPPWKFNYL